MFQTGRLSPIVFLTESQACAGSDINGEITGTMLKFLTEDNLPPYYKVKANMILSAVDEENGPEENLVATKHYLTEAEKALTTAKETYVHDAKDAEMLEGLEKTIKEEWVGVASARGRFLRLVGR